MSRQKHSNLQMTGLIMWRAGLLLAGSWGLLSAAKWLIALWLLPAQVNLGLAMILTGFVLFFISVVIEQRQEASS